MSNTSSRDKKRGINLNKLISLFVFPNLSLFRTTSRYHEKSVEWSWYNCAKHHQLRETDLGGVETEPHIPC